MENPFVENRFVNAHTGLQQTWLPCTIKTINETSDYTKRKGEDGEVLPKEEQTPFRRCVVEVTTPAGVKVLDANLWYASMEANLIVFNVGSDCAATFDLEGAYAGSVWLNLPPKRNVDASWFGAEFIAVPAPQPQGEQEGAEKLDTASIQQ